MDPIITDNPSDLKYLIGHHAKAIEGLRSMIFIQEFFMRREPESAQDPRMLVRQCFKDEIIRCKKNIEFMMKQLDYHDQLDCHKMWKIYELLAK